MDSDSKFSSRKQFALTPSLMYGLEPRVMLDAAAAATTAASANAGDVDVAPPTDSASVDTKPIPVSVNANSEDSHNQEQKNDETQSGAKEIVFIDNAVEDYQSLIAGLEGNYEIVRLDAHQDGVQQIADYLAKQTETSAIHIVAHGSEAYLQLGNTSLTLASMQGQHAEALQTISQALAKDMGSQNADIFIYGCNFGSGESGQQAAQLLAALTGADIAASTDVTGHSDFGGDWNLELNVGTFETTSLFSSPLHTINWQHSLDFNATANDDAQQLVDALDSDTNGITIDVDSVQIGSGNTGTIGTYSDDTGLNGSGGQSSGVVITTGQVDALAGDPQTQADNIGSGNNTDDADLTAVAPIDIGTGLPYDQLDVMSIEFSFTVDSDLAPGTKLALKFHYASEDYPEFAGDVGIYDFFVITISGDNPSGGTYNNQNLATVIDEVSSNPVPINPANVNEAENNSFYAANNIMGSYANSGLVMDAIVTSTSVIEVTPGATYDIAFKIADVFDGNFLDSALFIDTISTTPFIDLDSNNSTVAGSNYSTAYDAETATAVNIVDSDSFINNLDPSVTNIQDITVTLTNAQAGDTFNTAGVSGVTVTTATQPGQITLTLSGGANIAQFNSALQAITFSNSEAAGDVDLTTRSITFSVNDGSGTSNTAQSAITVTGPAPTPTPESNPSPSTDNSTTDTSTTESGAVYIPSAELLQVNTLSPVAESVSEGNASAPPIEEVLAADEAKEQLRLSQLEQADELDQDLAPALGNSSYADVGRVDIEVALASQDNNESNDQLNRTQNLPVGDVETATESQQAGREALQDESPSESQNNLFKQQPAVNYQTINTQIDREKLNQPLDI